MKLLWLAPVFNHYKAHFLNHLAKEEDVDLSVIKGLGRTQMGDEEWRADLDFHTISIHVNKAGFGYSKKVRKALKAQFKYFDWILVPTEKKNTVLFLYALWLRILYPKTKLFSYNHPISKSGRGKVSKLDVLISKCFYFFLDRVIFYTEKSCDWAIANQLIAPQKAFWANNTLDNTEIEKHYTFAMPPEDHFNLLFIGRLIPSKRLDLFLSYGETLQKQYPQVELHIIGDGPERSQIEATQKNGVALNWYGTLTDERDIAPIMEQVSLVFIPGHSGLSVNHAFMYGRPYITCHGPSHAPELDYLENGEEGFVLENNQFIVLETIGKLVQNRSQLEVLCKNAYKKGQKLSVQNWVKQYKNSLNS